VIADLADQTVNLVGCGRYPVTRGVFPGDAVRAVQAQPDGEQPVTMCSANWVIVSSKDAASRAGPAI
jgi:hypothetical protein